MSFETSAPRGRYGLRVCTGVHAWALGLGLLAGPALAQEEAERTHGPPILLEQVTPEYPEDATGTADVVVNVTVGVDGSVLQATPASGPAAFVPAALNAARQLVFEPAMHGGQPIETTIPVHFHFAPHEDEHIDVAVYEIVVETEAAGSTETHAVAVLDEEDLARAAGEDLAQTVSQVPGGTAARGTEVGLE